MKYKKSYIIGTVLGCAFLFIFIVLLAYYFLTYNYLLIYSPYIPYELGMEQVNIAKKSLLSGAMRSWDSVSVISELIDDDSLYDYDEETGNVNTAGKSLLERGRYLVEVSEGGQSEDIYVSVLDTQAPIFTNLYDEIVLEAGSVKKEGIVEYFNIFDYDDFAEFGVYLGDTDLGKKGVYKDIELLAWDTAGNIKREKVSIKILDERDVLKDPVQISVNRQGVRELLKSTEKKLKGLDKVDTNFGDKVFNGSIFNNREELENKIKELEDLHNSIVTDEERFATELLGDNFNNVINDIDNKEREAGNKYKELETNLSRVILGDNVENVNTGKNTANKKTDDDNIDNDEVSKKEEYQQDEPNIEGTVSETKQENKTDSKGQGTGKTESTESELMAKKGFYTTKELAFENRDKATRLTSNTENWGTFAGDESSNGGQFWWSIEQTLGNSGATYYRVDRVAYYHAYGTTLTEGEWACLEEQAKSFSAHTEGTLGIQLLADSTGNTGLNYTQEMFEADARNRLSQYGTIVSCSVYLSADGVANDDGYLIGRCVSYQVYLKAA